MRTFLPIKGPGGRTLTPREKVALIVLGITLVLCVLTLLAGEGAYDTAPARNPVYALVGGLSRTVGGGIVALYGLVLLWSGLIYFKGERIADITPIRGRVFAAIAVTVGISGALGVAKLETAGNLGSLVGGALGSALGGPLGLPMLLLLMLLGFHLAGKGAWAAMRKPAVAAFPHAAQTHGFAAPARPDASGRRMVHESPLPEDGDPSPDERTLAVTQAMEEIERSRGVTIVDVEPDADVRSTIGEEVEAAPAPEPETEEGQIQQGLREVSEVLETSVEVREADADDEVEEYESVAHGLVPVGADEVEEADPEPEEEDAPSEVEARSEETEELDVPAAEERDEDEEEDESPGEVADGDPYATGGLLRRLRRRPGSESPSHGTDRNYSSFDWRGRPLD
jgi:hypothetical protein